MTMMKKNSSFTYFLTNLAYNLDVSFSLPAFFVNLSSIHDDDMIARALLQDQSFQLTFVD